MSNVDATFLASSLSEAVQHPASGISPSEIAQVIGKKTISKILEDDVIKWDMLS